MTILYSELAEDDMSDHGSDEEEKDEPWGEYTMSFDNKFIHAL